MTISRACAAITTMVGAIVLAATPATAQPNTPMERLKAMAEDTATTPDLAEAALLASKLISPDVEPDTYQRKLDALASRLRAALRAQTQPMEIAVAMARFLYGEEAFANSTVQSADVFVGLDQVLDRKQWNCVGMALLYAALGDRLEMPLQPVAGYGHVLVAWNGDPYFFIETTAQGGLQPTRDYLIDYLPFPCVNPAGYKLLDERGSIAMCLTQMALVMQKDNRVQLAGSLFDLAITFSDTYAEAYAGRAFLKAAAQDHNAAVNDFERAIAIEPDLREAYGGLGTSYRALGNLASAVGTYRTLVSLCPDDSAAVFNTGQLLYETGDLMGAVQAYRHYINLEPRDPEGYVRLAYPLEDGGDLPGAAEAYRRALQLEPNYPDAILNLAYILEQMENFDAAMEGYRRALSIQPGNVQAVGGVARVLGKVNRYENAIDAFQQALKAYPGVAFLWADLGELLARRGEWKQAIGAYQEAIRVNPAEPESYYALARVFQSAGLRAEAQNTLNQARAVESANEQGARSDSSATDLPDPFRDRGNSMSDLFPGETDVELPEVPAEPTETQNGEAEENPAIGAGDMPAMDTPVGTDEPPATPIAPEGGSNDSVEPALPPIVPPEEGETTQGN